MSNLESETRRKLEILREAGFPIDQLAQSAVTGVVNQHQGQPDGLTSSTNESVKKDLSAILNSWVSGEIGDNDTLTKLFPLAVRYRYGDIDMMEFLKPEEQANLPLAKTVMAAWFAVVLQAPDAIQGIRLLAVNDMVGINLYPNPLPHYSGNFWWATSKYIATLKPLSSTVLIGPRPMRMNAEMWPASGTGRFVCLHYSSCNHYKVDYDTSNYLGLSIEDSMRAAKAMKERLWSERPFPVVD